MTQMRTVLATGPGDLLAAVPGLLGFHPTDSVVVLTVGDATHRLHARTDLPEDASGIAALADHLVSVVAENGVQTVAVVVYTDVPGRAERVHRQFARRLRREGVALLCSLRADGERWWRLDGGPDLDDPFRAGTPYDVGCHPLMAQAVVEGTVVLGSRQELADTLVGTDLDELDEVTSLAADLLERGGALMASASISPAVRDRMVEEGRWVRQRVRDHLRDRRRLTAPDVARLLVALTASTEVRDVAWAEMTHDNAGRHVDLWRDLVRRSPVELRAAPAALLGFAAWLAGDGALAWCAVDRAVEADPDYGLAALLARTLTGAVPPAVWTPIPHGSLSLFSGRPE